MRQQTEQMNHFAVAQAAAAVEIEKIAVVDGDSIVVRYSLASVAAGVPGPTNWANRPLHYCWWRQTVAVAVATGFLVWKQSLCRGCLCGPNVQKLAPIS